MKIFAYSAGALLVIFSAAFYALFLSPRPVATDPIALQGDGSTIDYCQLPTLDGSYSAKGGKLAHEIAKGNTPNNSKCLYEHFPLPILRQCREPLPDNAADMRGLWQAESGRRGHVERIEQCGRRVVITTSGIIHDSGPNATGGEATNDTEGPAFRLFGRVFCPRTSALMVWNEGVLDFHAFGFGPIVVRRYLEGDKLVWEYMDGTVTRMKRICKLPPEHKIPNR